MNLAPLQSRPKHRTRVGAGQLLLAVLLVWLQAATPFAHAMLHVSAARAAGAQANRATDRVLSVTDDSTSPEEKPCALCAADHLPALLERAPAAATVTSSHANLAALPVPVLSSRPLDLFCRPPPSF